MPKHRNEVKPDQESPYFLVRSPYIHHPEGDIEGIIGRGRMVGNRMVIEFTDQSSTGVHFRTIAKRGDVLEVQLTITAKVTQEEARALHGISDSPRV